MCANVPRLCAVAYFQDWRKQIYRKVRKIKRELK